MQTTLERQLARSLRELNHPQIERTVERTLDRCVGGAATGEVASLASLSTDQTSDALQRLRLKGRVRLQSDGTWRTVGARRFPGVALAGKGAC